jgi:hypothetical protein
MLKCLSLNFCIPLREKPALVEADMIALRGESILENFLRKLHFNGIGA